MILNEQDIIDALESYKNKHTLSGSKMAELCGMSGKSVYSEISTGKTKSLKSGYLLNFLINTGISLEEFSRSFDKQNYEQKTEPSSINDAPPYYDKPKTCNNPNCLKLQNELLEEIRQLNNEIRELRKGGLPRENLSEGGVEESKVAG